MLRLQPYTLDERQADINAFIEAAYQELNEAKAAVTDGQVGEEIAATGTDQDAEDYGESAVCSRLNLYRASFCTALSLSSFSPPFALPPLQACGQHELHTSPACFIARSTPVPQTQSRELLSCP